MDFPNLPSRGYVVTREAISVLDCFSQRLCVWLVNSVAGALGGAAWDLT